MDEPRYTLKQRFLRWLHSVTFCRWGEHHMVPAWYGDDCNVHFCHYCGRVTGAKPEDFLNPEDRETGG